MRVCKDMEEEHLKQDAEVRKHFPEKMTGLSFVTCVKIS
jgi:hypothetical protein